jgi:hypothetical protein
MSLILSRFPIFLLLFLVFFVLWFRGERRLDAESASPDGRCKSDRQMWVDVKEGTKAI